MADEITFDDFLAVDIRVGTVTRAEPFPEARKPATKLWVDFGGEIGTRKSSAQITAHYTPETLIGKQVLAVVNFPPRQIGPVRSEILVLGLHDDADGVVLAEPGPSCSKWCEARLMKLLITRQLPDAVIAAVEAEFDVTVREDQTPLTATGAKAEMQIYDAILSTLGDQFTADAFAEGVRCKMLANFGVGYNHINVDAAQAAGVQVSNTPGAVTDATADIALTLMLMACRRASQGERLVRSGNWGGWQPTQMLGLHMTGKTLGIIGMGRIGQAIAKRGHYGFDMKIVYQNRSAKSVAVPATQLDSIAEVAAVADVVVVAVPATPETHHLINADVFAHMKPTAHFVNIARGDIVDEAALIAALETGVIAGAGLDVYEFEPTVPDALKALENVVLFPHLGTAALEVREAMGLMAVDNLLAFKSGALPPNAV